MNPEIKDRFLLYLATEKSGGVAQTTIDRYMLDIEYLERELGNDLLTIKKYSELAAIIQRKNWASATRKHAADVAAVFFNWAFREGIIDDSPMRMGHEFKLKRSHQLDFFDWESEDFKKMIYDPENTVRENAILHTLRSSGLRNAELCALKRVDYQDRWLKVVGKGDCERFAPVDKECKFWLDLYLPTLAYRYTGPFLFVNADYRPLVPHTLWRWIAKKGQRLGIKAYPHKFRKSLGGELIKRGADITVAQRVLGHKDVDTTANYYVGFSKKSLLEIYDKTLETA